ncbi:hypothetical protein KZX47_13545 [Thermus sp. SYSU G05001]|uniref:Uncharacterized protein n=1 Tax=Thermus brevis TaxID=2862456 RepID=A0ABS7A1H7_9DEIN|nr:hypothetical protein [Thermus brevis]MBW6396164.1 hypothetical protein [Thermus brevis]
MIRAFLFALLVGALWWRAGDPVGGFVIATTGAASALIAWIAARSRAEGGRA